MINDSSIKDNNKDIVICEENIVKILERAIRLFRRTDLPEIADKCDRILKNIIQKRNLIDSG